MCSQSATIGYLLILVISSILPFIHIAWMPKVFCFTFDYSANIWLTHLKHNILIFSSASLTEPPEFFDHLYDHYSELFLW